MVLLEEKTPREERRSVWKLVKGRQREICEYLAKYLEAKKA